MSVLTDRWVTWLVTSRRGIPIAVLAAYCLTFAAKFLLAMWLLENPWKHERLLIADCVITGLLAAVLVLTLLKIFQERRVRLIEYIRRVADLNHHIRNAMQVIVYHSAMAENDPESTATIQSAVQRVDMALHAIFPIIGDPRDEHLRPHVRKSA